MYDLVVTGGKLPDGTGPCDICVREGKIESVLPSGTTLETREHIDAAGLVVFLVWWMRMCMRAILAIHTKRISPL